MTKSIIVAALAFGICGCAIAESSEISLTITAIRRIVLRSQVDGKRCDALNWPIDDTGCRDLEIAVGQIVLMHAKEASK